MINVNVMSLRRWSGNITADDNKIVRKWRWEKRRNIARTSKRFWLLLFFFFSLVELNMYEKWRKSIDRWLVSFVLSTLTFIFFYFIFSLLYSAKNSNARIYKWLLFVVKRAESVQLLDLKLQTNAYCLPSCKH